MAASCRPIVKPTIICVNLLLVDGKSLSNVGSCIYLMSRVTALPTSRPIFPSSCFALRHFPSSETLSGRYLAGDRLMEHSGTLLLERRHCGCRVCAVSQASGRQRYWRKFPSVVIRGAGRSEGQGGAVFRRAFNNRLDNLD